MEALLSSLVTENAPDSSTVTPEVRQFSDTKGPAPPNTQSLMESNDNDREYFPAVPLASQLSQPMKLFEYRRPVESDSPPSSSSSTTSSVDDLSKNLENLAIIDRDGLLRYYGNSSGLQMFKKCAVFRHRAVNVQDKVEDIRSRKKNIENAIVDKSPHHLLPEMPPPDLANHLIQLYFMYLYPVLPILHKETFLKRLRDPSNPPSPLLLNAIFAIASRISTDERVNGDSVTYLTAGETFFERAKALLDKAYDKINISTIQALLLLSSHQYGAKKGNRAWLYNGMAFRMAQNMGLNRNCDHWNISLAEREERKRVFWCCYIVDRITSAMYGRPITLDDRECDVSYPREEDDVRDGSMPILEYMHQTIKLCHLIGKLLQDIYTVTIDNSVDSPVEKVTKLHTKLQEWKVDLPRSMQYELRHSHSNQITPQSSLAICQLHMTYHTAMILLHRPYTPLSHQRIPYPSLQICISAAYSILNITETLSNDQILGYVLNYCCYALITAGGMFVSLAASDDTGISVEAKAANSKLVHVLHDLDHSWSAFTRYGRLFGDASSTANQLHTVNTQQLEQRSDDQNTLEHYIVSNTAGSYHSQLQNQASNMQQSLNKTGMVTNADTTIAPTPSTVLDAATYPSNENENVVQWVPMSIDIAEWDSLFAGDNHNWQSTGIEDMDIISLEDLLEL